MLILKTIWVLFKTIVFAAAVSLAGSFIQIRGSSLHERFYAFVLNAPPMDHVKDELRQGIKNIQSPFRAITINNGEREKKLLEE